MTEEQIIKKSAVEKILDEWVIDAKMDSTEPGEEIMRVSILHAKYIRYLVKYNSLMKSARLELAKLRKFKTDYYSGRLSEEELRLSNLKAFRFVLKGEITTYLDADDDIQALQRKIIAYEETSGLCTSILKQLEQRSYSLKTYCDWQKLQAGL